MFQTYRQLGIRTIPLEGKRPQVPWRDVTLNDRFEQSHPTSNIGAICGDVVTLVDVDNVDLLDFAVERFGDTPLRSKTPNGVHLWYRANGERRQTQLFGPRSIDLLGAGGYAVVPSSTGYTFTAGDPELIPHLPTIRPDAIPTRSNLGQGRAGERNATLFTLGRQLVLAAASEEELLDRLAERNCSFDPPLPDAEVRSVAKSVWRYRLENRVITGDRPAVVLYHDEMVLDPDPFYLLAVLKRNHGHRRGGEFILANAFANALGWTLSRFKKSVTALTRAGFLEITQAGGRSPGDPRRARLRV